MATVIIAEENRSLTNPDEIKSYLAGIGIDYERWDTDVAVDADASDDEILRAYSHYIEVLKAEGGYVAADVINVTPQTGGLEEMLARFNVEHTHDEDEVRFVVSGRGLFHIHPPDKPVVAIEVAAGDLIRVHRGTLHWFNLCSDRCIRAIRLFQNTAGWIPRYSGSGIDRNFQPVCFGPAYMSVRYSG